MQVGLYHRSLRVALLVFTAVLLFDSGFVIPATKHISDNTVLYLSSASVGVFGSVPQNEINNLTAQIAERERELNLREASLNDREIAARSFSDNDTNYSTYILSAILFLILVLLVLNYILDYTRVRRINYEQVA